MGKETRTIDEIEVGTRLTPREFMDVINNTSPQRLKDLTGIDNFKWYGYRQNSKLGRMTIDKMIEIARNFNCEIKETEIFFNL